ncbi:MAG TPA: hypothetical protein VGZ68_09155 [Acidimicrobiales bacterium]|nr:hypothetical protein [Acidimicrobiales bacterium]
MRTKNSTVIICVDCREDIEHCHGTAIIMTNGAIECSDDPDCRLGVEVHRFFTRED